MKLLIVFMLLFFFSAEGQKKDPDKIIAGVVNNFDKVKDYSVNVKVKLDVPFIKAPDTDAKIYFKQPDKIHFASENFAMVPKEGLDFSPVGLLKKDYTSIYVKDETLNGALHSVVKIIPLEDRGDVILSTLWIDIGKNVISRVESSTKTNGTFVIEMIYDGGTKYPLPSKMIFTFNFPARTVPGMRQDSDENSKDKKDEKTTGKVYITYSGYEINKGIPDSIFEKKEK